MQGAMEEREPILKHIVKKNKFDVLITSYSGANITKGILKHKKWHFVVIDEAHKIKNDKSFFS